MLVNLKRFFKQFLIAIGCCSIAMMMLAFTRLPYDMQLWLATKDSGYKFTPDYIIFLGGSGMPSGDNLMRLYYTAAFAKKFPAAFVIIAHPLDMRVIHQMKADLILHGVDSNIILVEKDGTSTREQVLKIMTHFKSIETKKTLLITSPENMMRSSKTFRKAGFEFVGGEAAFENAMFVNLSYSHKNVGGKYYAPDVSGNLDLRYNFWNYLKLEITCIRELFALGYYKLNGWI